MKHAVLARSVVLGLAAGHALLAQSPPASPSGYLVAWAGDADRKSSDFLAVIDANSLSPSYGSVLRTVLVGAVGTNPHHSEHRFSPGHSLFVNGFGGNRTFRFDLTDVLKPRMLGEVRNPLNLTYPHSFERLPNGHVLATMQAHDVDFTGPGGLAEYDDEGRVVRSASAAAPGVDNNILRPYSLAVLPAADRVVVASSRMGLPTWHPEREHIQHEHQGFHIQLWRLSDLRLLKTIALDAPEGDSVNQVPAEPRVLADGTVLISTMSQCGLYRVAGLEADTFEAELVYRFGGRACAVPVVRGNYWVQSMGNPQRVIAVDVRNPRKPVQASTVEFDARQWPHWLSADPTSDRIVMVNSQGETREHRMWMLSLDSQTGRLAIDERFRNPGADKPGLTFSNIRWPHGDTSDAIPHGTVFVRQE
jgi:hypothetical protein